MCTAISYRNKAHYFGRTLDVDFSYAEQVIITPRGRLFSLKNGTQYRTRYALIGTAALMGGCPMYYEAANERGLAMAGLNFPKSAVYRDPAEGKTNIAVFELIPWLLGQSETLDEVRALLEEINITNVKFAPNAPTANLHYLISDKTGSIVVESVAEGLKIYENPYHVMTNEPPFDYHCWNMQNYLNLSRANGENRFTDQFPLENYAVGMGALGLPGDVSSASRFVRAAFNLSNSRCGEGEQDKVAQFFHVLDSVAMVKGASVTDGGGDDITLYTCCINTDEGIYYYKTYENNQITAISMKNVDLDGEGLYCYPLRRVQQLQFDN